MGSFCFVAALRSFTIQLPMMKKYGLFGFLGFVSLSAVLTLSARAEDAPHVFISEINWAGSEKSTADEWLELVNLGATPADLSHYVVTGAATSGGAIEISEGTILAPGHTLLIANYALNDPKTTLVAAPDLVTSAVSLPNSGLNILLATPAGLVIDSYVDSGTPDFGKSSPATSIERDLTTLTWHSSLTQSGLNSAPQLGTPGSAVLPVPETVTPSISTPDPEPVLPVTTESTATPDPTPAAPAETPIPNSVASDASATLNVNTEIPVSEPSQLTSVTTAPVPEPDAIIPSIPVEIIESTAVEPVATPPPAEVLNTSVVQNVAPGDVAINELVSDPLDGTEWVEIINLSGAPINLSGSTLVDAGEHVTPLPDQTVPTDGFLVIENPVGNLNNAGDSVTLTNDSGTILDTLTYGTNALPAPTDGESLAKAADDTWHITTATEGSPNVFPASETAPIIEPGAAAETQITETEPVALSTQTYDTTTNTPDSLSNDSRTITQGVAEDNDTPIAGTESVHWIVATAKPVTASESASTKPKSGKPKSTDTKVVVAGTVIALPDTFGKQTMFINGHEIYFNAADWPELSLGDTVSITGTPGDNNGATRIKVKSPEDISVTGHAEVLPVTMTGATFNQSEHGTLVSIHGHVIGKSGDKLSLQTDDGTVITIVAYKKTGVTWSNIQSGDATFIGIVRVTDDGRKLYVRSNDDVQIMNAAITESTPLPKPKAGSSPLVGGGLLTGSIGALGTWYLRTKKGLLSWLPI